MLGLRSCSSICLAVPGLVNVIGSAIYHTGLSKNYNNSNIGTSGKAEDAIYDEYSGLCYWFIRRTLSGMRAKTFFVAKMYWPKEKILNEVTWDVGQLRCQVSIQCSSSLEKQTQSLQTTSPVLGQNPSPSS